MPRERLLGDVKNAKTLQKLNIASHRASVTSQFPRQIADRGGSLLQLPEQQDALSRQEMQERLDVIKGDHFASYFPVKNAPRKSFIRCAAAGRSMTDRVIFMARCASGCGRILLDVID